MKLRAAFGIDGRYRISTYKTGTKELLRQSDWIPNLIVLSDGYGLNVVMRQLSGDAGLELAIANASIGTGTTPPTAADTDLETPVAEDILIARIQNTTDEVVAEFFIADADLPNGSYTEFGVFVNSASKRLFARSIITPTYSKSAGEDTLVEYTFTVSAT